MMQPAAPGVGPTPSIVWVNQFALLPSDGGGTRHFELGRELVRRGWRVTVLASDLHLHRRTYTRRRGGSDRATIPESLDGVDFAWLWAAAYHRNDWRRVWNWMSFARRVKSVCRDLGKPSVIIGSSPQLMAAHAARVAARRLGVPFVFEVRDIWPEGLLAAGGRLGAAYHLLERLAWSLYEDADRILVLAKGTRDYLVERGAEAAKFIHVANGVDVHTVLPSASVGSRSDSTAPFVLVYAGAHGPANGLDRVLDAAEILQPSANVRFLLVGDGPSKEQLVRDANRRPLSNVEFRNAVSKAELVSIFSHADAGLMVLRDAPLYSFGVSPNKLFDYLAAGLPVVCNVPGEVAQMLNEAGGGVQATDTSGAALAAAIRGLLDVPAEQRRRIGMAGRDWVEREHSRETLGERLDGFLRELL